MNSYLNFKKSENKVDSSFITMIFSSSTPYVKKIKNLYYGLYLIIKEIMLVILTNFELCENESSFSSLIS